MTPAVSVIVPVYNVERYLDECIESICASTLKNIEILLIDDGATDSSGDKCDKWGRKDNRIKVFHKVNGGLSDARNFGIDHAQGEFLAFVDSDDKIHPDMLQKLYNACLANNTKVAICDLFLWEDGTGHPVYDLNNSYARQELDFYQLSGMFHNTAWCKIYHNSLFINKKVRFPLSLLHEDIGFWWLVMSQIDLIAIVNEALYYYRQDNQSSICKLRDNKRHASDTISSFYYGLKTALNLLPPHKKEAYLDAFLERYMEMFYTENITVVAQKQHKRILKMLKSAAIRSNHQQLKENYFKEIYIPYVVPLISIKLFKNTKKTYLNTSFILFGIKVLEISIGRF